MVYDDRRIESRCVEKADEERRTCWQRVMMDEPSSSMKICINRVLKELPKKEKSPDSNWIKLDRPGGSRAYIF